MQKEKSRKWKYYSSGGLIGFFVSLFIFIKACNNPILFIAGPIWGFLLVFVYILEKNVSNTKGKLGIIFLALVIDIIILLSFFVLVSQCT